MTWASGTLATLPRPTAALGSGATWVEGRQVCLIRLCLSIHVSTVKYRSIRKCVNDVWRIPFFLHFTLM